METSRPHERDAEFRPSCLLTGPHSPGGALRDLPAPEAVQLLSAGYETVLDRIPPGVTLCNGAGIHDASTAELALALTLASERDLATHLLAQSRSSWAAPRMWRALADKRVLVVGYGRIGRAIVSRLPPFEVEVTVVASRPGSGDDLVDAVHGIDELRTSRALPTSSSSSSRSPTRRTGSSTPTCWPCCRTGPSSSTWRAARSSTPMPFVAECSSGRLRRGASTSPTLSPSRLTTHCGGPRRHHHAARRRGDLGDGTTSPGAHAPPGRGAARRSPSRTSSSPPPPPAADQGRQAGRHGHAAVDTLVYCSSPLAARQWTGTHLPRTHRRQTE